MCRRSCSTARSSPSTKRGGRDSNSSSRATASSSSSSTSSGSTATTSATSRTPIAASCSRRPSAFRAHAVRPLVRLSEQLDMSGDKALLHAAQHGLEGVIAKRKSSVYETRRSVADPQRRPELLGRSHRHRLLADVLGCSAWWFLVVGSWFFIVPCYVGRKRRFLAISAVRKGGTNQNSPTMRS